jgi:CubicO group peptidase (beta-lactamase class C family)
MPVNHSEGLMLGARYLSPCGPGTPEAFGHVGFMPLLCWADPQRDVAAALLSSGKLLADTYLVGTVGVLRAIAAACRPAEPRPAPSSFRLRASRSARRWPWLWDESAQWAGLGR